MLVLIPSIMVFSENDLGSEVNGIRSSKAPRGKLVREFCPRIDASISERTESCIHDAIQ